MKRRKNYIARIEKMQTACSTDKTVEQAVCGILKTADNANNRHLKSIFNGGETYAA
jgi:hypothetical protein